MLEVPSFFLVSNVIMLTITKEQLWSEMTFKTHTHTLGCAKVEGRAAFRRSVHPATWIKLVGGLGASAIK